MSRTKRGFELKNVAAASAGKAKLHGKVRKRKKRGKIGERRGREEVGQKLRGLWSLRKIRGYRIKRERRKSSNDIKVINN